MHPDNVVSQLPVPLSVRGAQVNGSVEILRLLAAWGIVWFHAGNTGRSIGYAGLPLFCVIMIALATNANSKGKTLATVVWRRAERLLVPWVIWSLLYAIAKVAEALVEHTAISHEFSWWMLSTGPSLHLWFLPFAFFSTSAAYLLVQALGRRSGRVLFWALVLTLPSLGYLSASIVSQGDLSIPFLQWCFAFPSVMLGMIVGIRGKRFDNAIIVGAILATALLAFMGGFLSWSIPFAIGGLAAMIGWVFPLPAGNSVRFLGELALPIYLIHPLIISLVSLTPIDQLAGDVQGVVVVCFSTVYAIVHVCIGVLAGRAAFSTQATAG
ncbi:acyltransferase family protein [Aureliella helgolandensis]|uniref:Acyltransferase family protein n=1 Tax=Aureliella helgolandensis TaxID=2527968 RepID=A0A518GFE3_9BACT|nr:acyltransferase [Aureliella helgolandensis]QDV27316.1 Acyltransferase family protein [Aureliella helgolandensis]